MSVLLGRPNDARARPSTLWKEDDDYRKIFDPDYQLEVYLNSLVSKIAIADVRQRG